MRRLTQAPVVSVGGCMGTSGERYAVVSCHVERPLDDRAWQAFARLQERRPGGFAVAALLRPPDAAAGEDERRWVERAREAAARGPFGHHTHWTSPTHARPTDGEEPGGASAARGRLAARARACARRSSAAAAGTRMPPWQRRAPTLGYVDCTPRPVRPGYLATGGALGRARRARRGSARRRRPRPRRAHDAHDRRARASRAAPVRAAGDRRARLPARHRPARRPPARGAARRASRRSAATARHRSRRAGDDAGRHGVRRSAGRAWRAGKEPRQGRSRIHACRPRPRLRRRKRAPGHPRRSPPRTSAPPASTSSRAGHCRPCCDGRSRSARSSCSTCVGLALGLYLALVLRQLVYGEEEIFWNLLWTQESDWLKFLVPITVLVFLQAGLYAPRERRAGPGRLVAAIVTVALIVLAFGLGTGYEFTHVRPHPDGRGRVRDRDRPPARRVRLGLARGDEGGRDPAARRARRRRAEPRASLPAARGRARWHRVRVRRRRLPGRRRRPGAARLVRATTSRPCSRRRGPTSCCSPRRRTTSAPCSTSCSRRTGRASRCGWRRTRRSCSSTRVSTCPVRVCRCSSCGRRSSPASTGR